jgi:hypothetical protein
MANLDPVFVATPKSWRAHLSAANTNFDGTGTIVSIAVGGSIGSEIYAVEVFANGTTTAGNINFFIFDGANYRHAGQILVTAVTAGASTGTFSGSLSVRADGSPIFSLNNGDTLYASTYNAETFDVHCVGGDL